jgi:hypothetical protein
MKYSPSGIQILFEHALQSLNMSKEESNFQAVAIIERPAHIDWDLHLLHF